MKQLLSLYRNPFVWGTHMLGATIAFFVPMNVLSSSPVLSSYVGVVGEIFPPVLGYMQTSKMPEVIGLYCAVMFPLGLIWLWQGLTDLSGAMLNADADAPIWRTPRWVQVTAVGFGGFIFYIGLFYFGVRVNPGYDLYVLGLTRSRFGLALWGPLVTVFPWLMIATYVASLKKIYR